jgi:hypothetical protein
MQTTQAQKSVSYQRSDNIGQLISHIERGETERELCPLEPVRHIQTHIRNARKNRLSEQRNPAKHLSPSPSPSPSLPKLVERRQFLVVEDRGLRCDIVEAQAVVALLP